MLIILSLAEFYYIDPSITPPVLYDRMEFTYSGGKLIKVVDNYDTSSTGNQALVPFLQYDYTYTGSNITQVIRNDLLSNEADTASYEYDSNTNYYSKIPMALYVDYLFVQFDGVLLPFAVSANNVTKVSSSSGNSLTTYNLDSDNNLTAFLVDGDPIAKYFYKCQ